MRADDYNDLFYKFPNEIIQKENECLKGFILKHLSLMPRVLEIGCGSGYWVDIISTHGFNIVGVDIDCDRLKTANKFQNKKLVLSDAEFLPFADASFDTILLLWTIQEVICDFSLVSILEEVKRVIAPGGNLIIAENMMHDLPIVDKKSNLGVMHRGVLENKILRLFPSDTLNRFLAMFNFTIVNRGVAGDSFFENYRLMA